MSSLAQPPIESSVRPQELDPAAAQDAGRELVLTPEWGAVPPLAPDSTPASHNLFLIGDGIAASRTPALHEQEGRALGIPVTYRIVDSLELKLTEADLPEVVRWAKAMDFSGFNVTHPFKQSIIVHLDELSDRAQAVGAVNTVVLRGGRAVGHNTDWCGFQTPLRQALPQACTGTVVQVGAGGAGSAVAYAVLDLGAPRLVVHDLQRHRAEGLVARMSALFGAHRVSVGSDLGESLATAEGVINATPVGMAMHPGCPIPVDRISPEQWVSEIVYFPLQTELLTRARDKGCRTVDGAGMAAEQAVQAFQLFTGVKPNAARMHAHVRAMAGP